MGWVETRPKGATDGTWNAGCMSADGNTVYVAEYGGRLWRSADGCVSWSEVRPAGDANKNWQALACDADASVVLAGVDNGRLYLSTDSGANWSEVRPAGDANKSWASVASDSDGSVLMACVNGGRAYKSVNTGADWSELTPLGSSYGYAYLGCACDADGSVMLLSFPGVRNLYLSTNTGATWTAVSASNYYYGQCACDSDGSVLLQTEGTYGGSLLRSVNSGATWSRYGYGCAWPLCCDSDGSYILIGMYGGRLYESSDSGSTFTETQPVGGVDRNWCVTCCSSDGAIKLAGVYGGRLYYYSTKQYVSLPTLEWPVVPNPLSLTPGPLTVSLPTLTWPVTLKPLVLDTGGRTIRILTPRGTMDTPEVITDTTPVIQWAFTRTQGSYFVTVFDETDKIPAYDSGEVTSVDKTHTVTTALTPGHTYSVQVKCTDNAAEMFTSDERSWFHVNDATVDSPSLTAEGDTDHHTPVTLEWTAPSTTDGDTLTYEVELTYPNGTVKTISVGANTSIYLGRLPYA